MSVLLFGGHYGPDKTSFLDGGFHVGIVVVDGGGLDQSRQTVVVLSGWTCRFLPCTSVAVSAAPMRFLTASGSSAKASAKHWSVSLAVDDQGDHNAKRCFVEVVGQLA